MGVRHANHIKHALRILVSVGFAAILDQQAPEPFPDHPWRSPGPHLDVPRLGGARDPGRRWARSLALAASTRRVRQAGARPSTHHSRAGRSLRRQRAAGHNRRRRRQDQQTLDRHQQSRGRVRVRGARAAGRLRRPAAARVPRLRSRPFAAFSSRRVGGDSNRAYNSRATRRRPRRRGPPERSRALRRTRELAPLPRSHSHRDHTTARPTTADRQYRRNLTRLPDLRRPIRRAHRKRHRAASSRSRDHRLRTGRSR